MSLIIISTPLILRLFFLLEREGAGVIGTGATDGGAGVIGTGATDGGAGVIGNGATDGGADGGAASISSSL